MKASLERARAIAGRSFVGAARRRLRLRRYERALELPLDPNLAVFSAYWHRGYLCNPRAIFERAREIVPGFHGVWAVNRDQAASMPPDVDFVLGGSTEYYEAIARASVLVNNVNFEDEVVKRQGTTHVMTQHGTPLKYMGVDLRDQPIDGGHEDFDALLLRCARWDYTISSNRHSTEIWRRAYPVAQEILEVGYPRNDALVNPSLEEVRRLRRLFKIRPDQRAVLYAPTHRDNERDYVSRLDLGNVIRELPNEWMILARRHHRYDIDPVLGPLQAEGRIIDVGEHPLVSDVMLASDVLVTDYSSIMFDYAILDRPIVVHAPDWEQYKRERGVYFDLMAEPPGVVTRSDEELVRALTEGDAFSAASAAQRTVFRDRFCALERGTAAEQVVCRVWADRLE